MEGKVDDKGSLDRTITSESGLLVYLEDPVREKGLLTAAAQPAHFYVNRLLMVEAKSVISTAPKWDQGDLEMLHAGACNSLELHTKQP